MMIYLPILIPFPTNFTHFLLIIIKKEYLLISSEYIIDIGIALIHELWLLPTYACFPKR